MKQEYIKIIDYLNTALRLGQPSGIAKAYIKKEFGKQDTVIDSILIIFENVSKILDELKVKVVEDKVKYLSHTTKLSVFTKYLVPINSEGEPKLGKLYMYHIAYANDPNEGTVLLNYLDIAPEQIEASANIPYVMVASFCDGEDIKALDSLPMWSMYGDNAQGIALLFQTKDLAYSGPGHVGYSQQAPAMSNFKPTTSKKDGNNSLENKEVSSVLQDKKSTEKVAPLQILYRVHYLGSGNKIVNDNMAKIKTNLKQIEEKQQQIPNIYHKCLELLNGLRYLIKDKSYAYEQEYRLVCFAGTEHIPEILKREAPTEQDQEQKDTESNNPSRIYVETEILKKLSGVMTAPKVEKGKVLDIQYLLDWYTNSGQFLKQELPVHKSSIPYR